MSWLVKLIEALFAPLAPRGASPAAENPAPSRIPPATEKPQVQPVVQADARPGAQPDSTPPPAAATQPDGAVVKVRVAEFKNDRDQAFTRRVIDTLKTAKVLDVGMATVPFEGPGEHPSAAKLAQFHAQARSWLEDSGADLLIHGNVARVGLRLRLVATVPPAEGRPDAVGLADAFLVPHNFGAELANLLYASVLAAALPAKPDRRRDLAPQLAVVGERCLKLLDGLPDGIDASQIGAVYTWLGVVAAFLWRLHDKPAALRAAVAAFEKANREGPKEITPVVMAELKTRLGLALQELAAIDGDTGMFEDAVSAFETVTGALDPATHPREWGLGYLCLAGAYFSRGRKDLAADDCSRAVAACDAALRVFTKDKDPRRWRETMSLKGTALVTAGTIGLGVKDLEAAVEALREVLDTLDRAAQPLQWAQASNGLGSAVFALAKRTQDRACLDEAIQYFDGALAVYEERQQAVAIGVVGKNLQRAHRLRDTLGS